jgi:DNA-binding beta-propeller fold protein YncE
MFTKRECRARWAIGPLALLLLSGCTEKPTEPIVSYGNERPSPAPVQQIFDRSCNASGCHGTSNPGAGLELVTWDRLILGSQFGENVIPYWPDESHMVDHLTGVATPRMPLSRDPLPASQIETIRQWIAAGAPNDLGDIPYAHSRRKLIVTNQGSDKLSVIDVDHLVVMRLTDVGVPGTLDSPHNVFVDPQNKYYYVSLINTARVLKFNAETDALLSSTVVGQSPANPVTSPDGKTLYVTNWNPQNPTLYVLNAETMVEKYHLTFPPGLGTLPHGLTITRDGTTLYTTHEGSGMVFRIQLGQTADDAILTPISLGQPALTLRPLQVLLDANEQRLFVTCNGSGEVRVINLATDELEQVIPILGKPWLLDMTADGQKIYVGNWGKDGVDVIDTGSLQFETLNNATEGAHVFARPHGVVIAQGYAFVSNENTNGSIPQHHPTQGGGDDGAVTVIDLNTHAVKKLLTVEVDPTGVAFVQLP